MTAYEKAKAAGKQTALATLVHVEGSSYRRPGARMLVTEEGELTGAISGGCLEGDALKKALLAMSEQKNKLVTYDTTNEDDALFGVQLGCNGIVHILFEPIEDNNVNNAVNLLKQAGAGRRKTVIVTLFSLAGGPQYGTALIYRQQILHHHVPPAVLEAILPDIEQAFANQISLIKNYQQSLSYWDAFIQFIAPPVQVVIAGAGNDVMPLVDICHLLGWQTIIADGRKSHANVQRFPKAGSILVSKPAELLSQINTDNQTVFLLMTHNYNYDIALLRSLVNKQCRYIGILGPKKKLQRMLTELKENGLAIDTETLTNICGPVGLDIGAETPEEIALSIASEIKAILSGRKGGLLKDLDEPIHSRISLLMHDA